MIINVSKRLSSYIISITRGNKAAIDALYKILCKDIFMVAYSMVKDVEEASKILHDTFIRIVEKANTYKDEGNPKAWIFAIVKHLAIDKIRKKSRLNEVEFDETKFASFDTSDEKEITKYLFSKLSKEESEIIGLRYLCGYTLKEVSQMLNIKLPTLEYKIKRIKEKLRQKYKELQEATD